MGEMRDDEPTGCAPLFATVFIAALLIVVLLWALSFPQ